jgi:hypothetical protein
MPRLYASAIEKDILHWMGNALSVGGVVCDQAPPRMSMYPIHEYCALGRNLTNWERMPLSEYVYFICINLK